MDDKKFCAYPIKRKNVKAAIHAMLTVLPRSLWRLSYRWVKCRWYPALLPRILPVVTLASLQAHILPMTSPCDNTDGLLYDTTGATDYVHLTAFACYSAVILSRVG